jgi:hypothetical protein
MANSRGVTAQMTVASFTALIQSINFFTGSFQAPILNCAVATIQTIGQQLAAFIDIWVLVASDDSQVSQRLKSNTMALNRAIVGILAEPSFLANSSIITASDLLGYQQRELRVPIDYGRPP